MFTHQAKKFLLLLFLAVSNIQASEYLVFNNENLINAEQVKLLEQTQEEILKEQNTLVSYAFYSVGHTKATIRMNWLTKLKEAAKQEESSARFHLLLCVRVSSSRNTVDIFYENPPALDDPNDLSTCISSLQQSIASAPSLDELITQSSEPIKSQLSYINARPKLEEKKIEEANNNSTKKFMGFVYKVIKITLMIVIPIIAIFTIYYMVKKLNNQRPHHFPAMPESSVKQRLGAPFAATSIAKSIN